MNSLTDKLESVGIKINPYKKGPISNHIFAITVDKDTIRIWEGDGDVIVSTNKRKRQAVITVTENSRKVNTICRYLDVQNVKDVTVKYSKAFIRSSARIQVPNSRMKILSVGKNKYLGCNAKLQFITRKTTTSFLVGYDLDAEIPFISQLRNVVKTVDEAHKELKPKNTTLKSNYKRQGEWFFNPVNDSLNKELMKLINKAKYGPLNTTKNHGYAVRSDSSHMGIRISYNKKRYAVGAISDLRKNRHKPIILTRWHEIIHNNEANPTNISKRTFD